MTKIDVERLIAQWLDMHQIDIRSEFRGVTELELWRCDRCGVLFFAPEVIGSPFMYAELSKREWYYLDTKWEYGAALEDLKGKQRALEIGCGSGSFMMLAQERCGLFVEGLEQNGEAIAEATRRGLGVRCCTVEDAAEESGGTYDAVCGFQVLEHVSRPKEFLGACCKLLRPGGLLILAVPNQDGYVGHLDQPLDSPPHHMTRWTKEPLERLQDHFPLKLRRALYEPLGPNQLVAFVDGYARALRRRRIGFFLRPWVYPYAVRLAGCFSGFLRGHSVYACYVRT